MGQVASAPSEADPAETSVYELIRRDIISGQLGANARLKVSELARRYASSTNPVREALQQLRGEGFVIIEPNRGARVRPDRRGLRPRHHRDRGAP